MMIAVGVCSSACTIVRIAIKLSVPPPIATVRVPAYDILKPTTTAIVRVGVGKAELTPVPGFPTGGHGPAGSLSYGYWTRLYARAFVLQDTSGETLVLVSCDLVAIPAGLHATVAHHVITTWASRGIRVTPEGIILAATHTHQGPGNYLTAETYNEYGSNYPGFNRELFNFLARQVSTAIDSALADAQRYNDPVQLIVRKGALPATLLRNRSPRTFLYNQNARTIMQKDLHNPPITNCEAARLPGEEALSDWNLAGCPRLRAVDRTLTVLELQRGSHRIGLLLFFATHPTALAHRAAVYSADFTGIAVGVLEKTGPDETVVGFFNGAEGDITTRRTTRNLTDTFNLANQLVTATEAVLAVAGSQVPVQLGIRHRALTPQAVTESCGLAGHTSTLSATPVIGTAALGGGEGDRTLLYDIGWKEGVIDRHRTGQGPKLPALDSQLLRAATFTDSFAPPKSFPQTVPVTYVKLGGLQLAAVPGELSTAQGARIRSQLGGVHRDEVEIIGLANEYVGYVATQDEYHAQDYMAASTIWGPQEGEVITCTLAHLKDDPPQRAAEDRHVAAASFRAGPKATTPFGPSFLGEVCARPDAELSEILTNEEGTPVHGLPWFRWDEQLAPKTGLTLEFDDNLKRRVAIHSRTNPTAAFDDDQGPGIVTVLVAAFRDRQGRDHRTWTATWVTPLWKHPGPGFYSFRITRPDGTTTCSEYFQLPQPLSETTEAVETASHCPPS
jgi:neutral ceramidase